MVFFQVREPSSALTHGLGLILAAPAIATLWRRSRGTGPGRRLGLMVFGFSLALCYAASTLFHALPATGPALVRLDRLDRVGIFALIAGTYTPLAGTLLRGGWRWGTLLAIWGVAGVASAFLVGLGSRPPTWSPFVCLAMGWGVLACYGPLARSVGHHALIPLVVGGVCYTVGAVLNLLHWPDPWPGHFSAHEVFHVFVLLGSLAHYKLMLNVVVPYRADGGAVRHQPARRPHRPAPARSTSAT